MTVSPVGAARWAWEPIDYNDRANRKNRLSSGLSLARRLLVQRAYGYPKEICPEVSSHCWMRCKYCWLGACHISDHRDTKFMELGTFKALIDDVAVFGPRVTMAGCGEPLANNKVYDMIRYAADHGLMVSLFTNALNLNDTNTQRIFESGLYRINLSLDSTDPGEFEQMRGTREDHAKVLRNTKLFIRAKKQRHRKYPLVQLQTIRVRPNQGAIAQFVQDARAMGADIVKVKSLALYPQADQRFHRWILDNLWIDDPAGRYHTDQDGGFAWTREGPCPSVGGPAMISCDGDVYKCQYDIYGNHRFGNVAERPFTQIWRSKKFSLFRRDMMGLRGWEECFLCGDTTPQKSAGRTRYYA